MEKQGAEKIRKIMNELSPDVLVQILSRLPEKSLCRFLCVSKEWYSLISSPDPGFVKDLRLRRLRPNQYLYIWSHIPFEDYTLHLSIMDVVTERIQDNYCSQTITDANFRYMISCHNLLCFVGRRLISIHNLSTRESTVLPDCGHIDYVGFGYSSLANEYKMVRWFRQKNDGMTSIGCKIFSLSDRLRFKSDSWRLIETRPFDDQYLIEHSVSINGVVYWLNYMEKSPNIFQLNSILSLDLNKEESKTISCPKPSPTNTSSACLFLLELKECLYLAQCCWTWEEKAVVKMWKLEDPKNCAWVSEYYIKFPFISSSPIVPLTSVITGHVEKLVFILVGSGDLLYYNVETGTMRMPDNLRHLTPYMWGFPCVLKYMEF